jgi:RNA polymerase sigma-70 factor (ECF subfamily)
VTSAQVARAYQRSGADTWTLSKDAFAGAIERSVRHAFSGHAPASSEVGRYLDSLHLEDLALAVACAAGIESAWEHFVREHRPVLYRAASAIDRAGGGRELADSLYADLFGLRERDGERQSLFQYFHGRSSLGSWVRAVLAQRHIDRVRASRRLDPLPDDDAPGALPAVRNETPDGAAGYQTAMSAALLAALAALAARDRLRVSCYYAQNMKLAAIGRMLGEHEASVSRHLARARREIKAAIETYLRGSAGYTQDEVLECFRTVAGDSGPLNLEVLLEGAAPGKNQTSDRS